MAASDYLNSEEDVKAYLEAVVELNDPDPRLTKVALKDVGEARVRMKREQESKSIHSSASVIKENQAPRFPTRADFRF